MMMQFAKIFQHENLLQTIINVKRSSCRIESTVLNIAEQFVQVELLIGS